MPIWLYQAPPLYTALVLIFVIVAVSMIGLFLARRYLVPRFTYGEGINDAISGTVQAIGVFYGITVGLIAVAVWDNNSKASDLVSREASAIGGLYRDVRGLPSPLRDELASQLRDYTTYIVEQSWPAQEQGRIADGGTESMSEIQAKLYAYEPTTLGKAQVYGEALSSFNHLADARRLRLSAVTGGLSGVMWAVIWVGAVISIGVAYLFKVQDAKMHALLIALMSGFLAIVLFMIVINDKPFYGSVRISPEPYQKVLERMNRMN